MLDGFGRNIEYLRISVTERCNLRCIYCVGELGCHSEDNCNIELTPTEIGNVARASAKLGINRVRITGGEPLIRKDICEIVGRVASIGGIQDLSLTTNAVFLDQYAKDLKIAGLKRVNISLDSLKVERLFKICGTNVGDLIFKGIYNALEYFAPLRVNVVLIKGINDDEIPAFINLAKEYPVDVRFIELMPMSDFGVENSSKIIRMQDILQMIPELGPFVGGKNNGPAKYYTMSGLKGRIGFISPISHTFCEVCNRIRLTSDGKIRPCLGNNGEVDILKNIRSGENLSTILSDIILTKPKGHSFASNFSSHRKMFKIGG